jgi:hypothetical protein
MFKYFCCSVLLGKKLAGRVSEQHPSVILCLTSGYWSYVMQNGFEVFVPEQDVLHESKFDRRVGCKLCHTQDKISVTSLLQPNAHHLVHNALFDSLLSQCHM